jgi:mRNA interferase HigB
MHLITIRNLRQDATPYPDEKQLNDWNDIVKGANWQSLIDVQTIYRDAEAVGNFTVFNIKVNKYRLIVSIDYEAQLIYYKYFLTHAEYDRENWKNDDYY